MITDAERRIPAIAVTGTNGKTTTTRLIGHMFMQQGKHVGWSSTSGVYIDGEEVIAGDYSGPSGARRVLTDPSVEVAVLETARGGILLRGLACESNDVSVFTNISGDHLNLHGVRTVEGLAEVKAVVVHTTRPDGVAVLNADDPLVMSATRDTRAGPLLFALDENNAAVARHRASSAGMVDSSTCSRTANPRSPTSKMCR
jgi:cyanophycin synthetase